MADKKIRISELPSSTDTDGLYTLGVNAQNEGVKIPIGELIAGAKAAATEACSTINSDISTINSDISTINSDISTINSDISTINSGMGTMSGKIDVINSDISSINADIEGLQEEVADTYRAVEKHLADVGIFPFDGTVTTVSALSSQLPVGSVWYVSQQKYFVKITESGPSTALPHNALNDAGGVNGVRDDVLFRTGSKLYYFNGSGIVEADSRTISAVMQRVQKLMYNAEKEIGVFAFDGIVQHFSDIANEQTTGTIWFVRDENCFYQEDGSGLNNFIQHNDANEDYTIAREGDAIYSYNGDLYIFNGTDLEYWEPWLLRDDVNDLSDEVEGVKAGIATINSDISSINADIEDLQENVETTYRAVDKHLADVGIFPFDGIAPSASAISASAAIGSVWYLTQEKRFVKVTTSEPTTSLTHNTFNDVGGVTGVRADVLFRTDSKLYRHDGNNLVLQTDDVEKTKIALFDSLWATIGGTKLTDGGYRMGADGKALTLAEAMLRYERNAFIDRWNRDCRMVGYDYYGRITVNEKGKYNEATGCFELHGLTDITYEEAENIMAVPRPGVANINSMWFSGYNIRTNPPIYNSGRMDYIPFFGQYRIEVIDLPDNTTVPNGLCYQCFKLHTIRGVLSLTGSQFAEQCGRLENMTVKLTTANVNYKFSGNGILSYDSVKYMIDNTTVACTITFHPNIYAKLTGDTDNAAAAALTEEELAQWMAITTAASAKNITFVTV